MPWSLDSAMAEVGAVAEAVEGAQGGGVKTRGVVGLATLVLVLKMAAVMRMTAEEVLDTPTLVVQTTSFQALERPIAR